jgi:hypothetical protein
MSDVLISNMKGRKKFNPDAVNQLVGNDLFHSDRNGFNSPNIVGFKLPSVTISVYSIMYTFTCQCSGNVTDNIREIFNYVRRSVYN